jgi:hypothetical protein
MTNRISTAIVSAALGSLALATTGCTIDAAVEVTNRCAETVVVAHFDEGKWAPEFRDEKLAEVEWLTLEPGASYVVRAEARREPSLALTVVADGADQVWDPMAFNVMLEDPEDWHNGTVELTGDACG